MWIFYAYLSEMNCEIGACNVNKDTEVWSKCPLIQQKTLLNRDVIKLDQIEHPSNKCNQKNHDGCVLTTNNPGNNIKPLNSKLAKGGHARRILTLENNRSMRFFLPSVSVSRS